LAREWLSRPVTLVAGLLMALWPHLVAATGALLSEVVYGFVLMFAMLAFALALRGKSRAWAWASGLAFGYAYLTNPVIALLPFALAWLLRGRGAPLILPIVVIPLLFVAGWGARSATLPDVPDSGRFGINLVQGSQPFFLDAWAASRIDPGAQRFVGEVDEQARRFSSHPAEVLRSIGARVAGSPAAYAHWYLLEKPWLLWDWNIRVGAGGVYVMSVSDSSLDRTTTMRTVVLACRTLNLPMYLLSALVALLLAWRGRGDGGATPQVAVALLCIYVTAIHTILQSEPRYSIPYRPFEILLFVTGVAMAWHAVQARVASRAVSA
jgi:4-amino-4-deoxy-L-arabinose transferase-like glycosyltransferase